MTVRTSRACTTDSRARECLDFEGTLQGRDAAYAELRRSGALKKSYIAHTEGGEGDGGNAGAKPTPADPSTYRRLDRALQRSGHAARLNDQAYQRLEQQFASENPDDADGWVKDYFAGFGIAPQTAAPPPAAAAPNGAPASPLAATPVSDRGAPAAPRVPIEELNLVTASNDDRAAYIKAKGLKAYTAALRAQVSGVRVKVGNG